MSNYENNIVLRGPHIGVGTLSIILFSYLLTSFCTIKINTYMKNQILPQYFDYCDVDCLLEVGRGRTGLGYILTWREGDGV